MKIKRLSILLIAATILLAIPLIAMQFTKEVDWNLVDFIFAGIFLFGSALGLNSVIINIRSKPKRILAVSGIVFLLLLIWAELAVGLFGTPFAGS